MNELNEILNILGFEFDPIDRTLSKKSKNSKLELPELIDGKVLKGIGTSAFYKEGLTGLRLPAQLETIGDIAFAGNHLHEIVLPTCVKSIGCMAFANNPLSRITLPTSLEFIDDDAFLGTAGSILIVCEIDSYAHKFAVDRGYNVNPLTYREMERLYDDNGY